MADPSETTHRHGGNAYWRQFWLLFWKNWLLQKRKVVRTVLIFLIPIVCSLFMALGRHGINPSFTSSVTTYDSIFVNPIQNNDFVTMSLLPPKLILAYVPNTTLVSGIVNRAATALGITDTNNVMGFQSESVVEDYVSIHPNVYGVIVFPDSDQWSSLPKNIIYKIRLRSERTHWKTDTMFDRVHTMIPRNEKDKFGGDEPGYYRSFFLAIQHAVDLSLIAEVNRSFDPTTMNVTTQLKRYPYPPYIKDTFVALTPLLLSMSIWLSYFVMVPTICQEIVLEKENKFKESMKMMGMRNWLYWSSWFVKYLLFTLTIVIIMMIIFHSPITRNGSVLGHNSASVTFVFLLLHALAIITFCFLMSTLVSRAIYGAALGYVFYILFYMIPSFAGDYSKLTLSTKLATSLDFHAALTYGFTKMADYEQLGIGVQWSNIASQSYAGDDFTMAYVLIMLLVDVIIYSLLAWYLDAVIPSEFGTPQPLYFPFTKMYWTSVKGDQQKLSSEDFMTLVPEDRKPYFEVPLQEAKAGIQIRGLTKSFGYKTKPAVNDLNIDIYEGNITALVGHNGAGKTTAMFMLAGFLPPSKGTAYISGFDITQEMDKIRENLGLCPQHDILFDTLTVREHLLFYAVLKGSSFKRATQQMNEMVDVLQMRDKLNVESKALSGGQRRKLSVGIALIAGSKFVILDEPTSGMDPEARRQTWDILQSQRKDRTMLLSTHYMDEADQLGDRVAIMSNGEIQCYGTPMFLKNKYGVGYHLTFVKTSTCDVDKLRAEIKSQIPMAHMLSNEAEEVMFALPSNQSSKFEELFESFETDGKTLGIKSFGVAATTMEEVFIRVNESSTPEMGHRMSRAAEILGNASNADVLPRMEIGWNLEKLQLRAMFFKRIMLSKRNYILTLSQILIPVFFVALTCVIEIRATKPDLVSIRALTLDLTHFKRPVTPYDVRAATAEAKKLSNCYYTSIARQSEPVLIGSGKGYNTMDDYLVGIGKDHADDYYWSYEIGAAIEETPDGKLNITGYFNNQVFHTIAISLSYLGNTLMQCFGDKNYHIETINHPFPKKSSEQASEMMEMNSGEANFSFGLGFHFTICLFFLLKERKSGAKHSQLVSGVRLRNFWLATFIWDYVIYLATSIVIVLVFLTIRPDGYWQNYWIVIIVLVIFGVCLLPFVYLMSLLFGEPSSGCIWFLVIYIVTEMFPLYILLILKIVVSENTWQAVEWIFYIFLPMFCFDGVFNNIHTNYENHKFCNQMTQGMKLTDFCALLEQRGNPHPCCLDNCGAVCMKLADNYLSWTLPGVGRSLIFMVLQGIVFFFILYIIETDLVVRLLKLKTSNQVGQAKLTEMNADDGRIEDSDVVKERQHITSKSIQEHAKTDPLVIKDLTKLYGNFVAVNKLSIGVPHKECFGLLGVNGAGKTTTFKMLTGETHPSFGSAYVAGFSVQGDITRVHQKIGYCPQFDSIIDQLTVHETLWMYACAHGIPAHATQQVIDRLIERLTLKPYTHKRAGKLSGGNKRKLCVAVALMGNPTVVFLDEPTTGVDPEARRRVWNTLAAARNTGATIVLTSHSMEECEAICTRMGILVNGRFLCLGSLQHLRDKFSFGYSLTIKLQRSATTDKHGDHQERVEKLKAFVSRTFPNSFLKDHHENMLSYQVNVPTFKWSEVFGIMEKAKVKYEIEDYSVGQTTLEQLFIAFARLQRGAREIAKKKFCGLC